MKNIIPYEPETIENSETGGVIREKLNENFSSIQANFSTIVNKMNNHLVGKTKLLLPDLIIPANYETSEAVIIEETPLFDKQQLRYNNVILGITRGSNNKAEKYTFATRNSFLSGDNLYFNMEEEVLFSWTITYGWYWSEYRNDWYPESSSNQEDVITFSVFWDGEILKYKAVLKRGIDSSIHSPGSTNTYFTDSPAYLNWEVF